MTRADADVERLGRELSELRELVETMTREERTRRLDLEEERGRILGSVATLVRDLADRFERLERHADRVQDLNDERFDHVVATLKASNERTARLEEAIHRAPTPHGAGAMAELERKHRQARTASGTLRSERTSQRPPQRPTTSSADASGQQIVVNVGTRSHRPDSGDSSARKPWHQREGTRAGAMTAAGSAVLWLLYQIIRLLAEGGYLPSTPPDLHPPDPPPPQAPADPPQ